MAAAAADRDGAAGEPVLVIRCVWTVGGEPGALSTSYLPERLGQLWPDLAAPPFPPPGEYPPVAITTAMLRPDLFRIVIQAGAGPDGRTDGFASAWTHAATGWEP
jgi:hypothetical protein